MTLKTIRGVVQDKDKRLVGAQQTVMCTLIVSGAEIAFFGRLADFAANVAIGDNVEVFAAFKEKGSFINIQGLFLEVKQEEDLSQGDVGNVG